MVRQAHHEELYKNLILSLSKDEACRLAGLGEDILKLAAINIATRQHQADDVPPW